MSFDNYRIMLPIDTPWHSGVSDVSGGYRYEILLKE